VAEFDHVDIDGLATQGSRCRETGNTCAHDQDSLACHCPSPPALRPLRMQGEMLRLWRQQRQYELGIYPECTLAVALCG
jgi:hypothetical protein